MSAVDLHLHHHRIQGLELDLITQLGHELDLDRPAVEVAGEVEYMRFEQWLDPADRGPRAQTRDSGKRTRIDSMDPHRRNTPHRRPAAHQSQVRRRKAERAA